MTIVGTPSNITIFCGVPQGLVLGPILFNLYTTPFSTLIANTSLSHHLYADDTQLHLFFKTSHLLSINFNPLSPLFSSRWPPIFSPKIHPRLSSCSLAYLSSYPKNSLYFTFPSTCSTNSSLFICMQSRFCICPISLLQPTNLQAL